MQNSMPGLNKCYNSMLSKSTAILLCVIVWKASVTARILSVDVLVSLGYHVTIIAGVHCAGHLLR